MRAAFLGETLEGYLTLNDETAEAALEMARNFREGLGPERFEIAEYDTQDGLMLHFTHPVGDQRMRGIHFHTTDPMVVTEILEIFHFGYFEELYSRVAGGADYFHHRKGLAETGR